jgi:hypothetical protein
MRLNLRIRIFYFVTRVTTIHDNFRARANFLCSRSEGRPAGRPYIPFAFFAVKLSESESSFYVTFVPFVVKSLLRFGCGFAALGPLWLNFIA